VTKPTSESQEQQRVPQNEAQRLIWEKAALERERAELEELRKIFVATVAQQAQEKK